MPEKLGPTEQVTATIDTSGLNTGNYTAAFTPQILSVSLPEFECYHIAIDSGPPGSSLRVYIGISHWDSTTPGNDTGWDPNNPMPIQQGQTVYLYWGTGTGPAPMATLWLQEASVL